MSKKKEVFRVNDRIRILKPDVFVRCGYPLTTEMVRDTMTEEQIDAIHQMCAKFGIVTDARTLKDIGFGLTRETVDDTVFNLIRNIMAGRLLRQKGWGGSERRIYTEFRDNLLNATGTINGKRVVKTGDYVSGCSYRGYFDAYDDYEPPYLDGEETHVILEVYTDWGTTYPSTKIEIERCHVEKISKDIRDPDHFIVGTYE